MGKKWKLNMEENPNLSKIGHFWIILAIALPVYLAALFYTSALTKTGEEPLAMVITIFFILGIYVGRYIAQFWTSRQKEITVKTFFVMGGIILATIVLVFVMAGLTLRAHSQFLALLFMGIPLLILSVTVGIFVKMLRTSIRSQLTEAKADAAQSLSELQLLQSQLSPHFLFNTLNNIYGISLTRHEKVPPLLLKLSDLLRYSVYEARDQFVPLQNELEYIYNYLEFEKIRTGEKLKLTTEIELYVDPKIKIAPLLLIVFVENAFKHAKNTTGQEIMIDIKLKLWGKKILFFVKNSNSEQAPGGKALDGHSGFGLENVRKRLELLYPSQYDLTIDDNSDYYNVLLQLKAK